MTTTVDTPKFPISAPKIRKEHIYFNDLPKDTIFFTVDDRLLLYYNIKKIKDWEYKIDWADTVDEYPTGIKKIYVRGDSEKDVPRMVMHLKTYSFTTRPPVVDREIDRTFREL